MEVTVSVAYTYFFAETFIPLEKFLIYGES